MKELGQGKAGHWWSPQLWKWSKNQQKWPLGTWVSDHGGIRSKVGLDDLGSLFHVNDSMDLGKEPH